jgi:hypothetical protein
MTEKLLGVGDAPSTDDNVEGAVLCGSLLNKSDRNCPTRPASKFLATDPLKQISRSRLGIKYPPRRVCFIIYLLSPKRHSRLERRPQRQAAACI